MLHRINLLPIKIIKNAGRKKTKAFIEFICTSHNSVVFLLFSNLTNGLRLNQFLGTKTTEANKSLKTNANEVH